MPGSLGELFGGDAPVHRPRPFASGPSGALGAGRLARRLGDEDGHAPGRVAPGHPCQAGIHDDPDPGFLDRDASTLSGGEATRIALAGARLARSEITLLDEPTNNLDPASREEILGALANFEGAVVLVSHDPGAVAALDPERVLMMPDAVEDLWNAEYQELIELA